MEQAVVCGSVSKPASIGIPTSILQKLLRVTRHGGLCQISPRGTFSLSYQTPCTNNVWKVWIMSDKVHVPHKTHPCGTFSISYPTCPTWPTYLEKTEAVKCECHCMVTGISNTDHVWNHMCFLAHKKMHNFLWSTVDCLVSTVLYNADYVHCRHWDNHSILEPGYHQNASCHWNFEIPYFAE